jgi:hypothetical protein
MPEVQLQFFGDSAPAVAATDKVKASMGGLGGDLHLGRAEIIVGRGRLPFPLWLRQGQVHQGAEAVAVVRLGLLLC